MHKLLIANDIHAPYHCPRSQAILLSVISDWRPDTLVIAGDLVDFYALSPFDRDPKRRALVAQELSVANAYLDTIDSAAPPSCTKIFEGGNHEDRFRRSLWRTPELADLADYVDLDIPTLLGLRRRNWQYVPYYDPVASTGAPGYPIPGGLVTHGIFARRAAGATAKAHFDRFHTSGVNGHTHRLALYSFRSYGGNWQWAESGCLCQLEPSYTPSPDWQQGFITAYISDRIEFRLHNIHNGQLSLDGHPYHS